MSSLSKAPFSNWLDEVVASVPVAPYYRDDAVVIFNADCKEIVPQMPKACLLLTDPPYGLAEKHNGGGGMGKSSWKNLPSVAQAFDMQRPSREVFTMMLESSDYKIIWGGNYFADLLPPSMGWLSWDKDLHGFTTSDFELAWTSWRRAARRFTYCCSNERGFAPGAGKDEREFCNSHPTQKPLALMKWCIGLAGDAQTILDPFAGSGTTGRAAKDLGRKCVMIEMNEAYCEISARRMRQEVLPLFGSQDAQAASGDVAVMDARDGR